MNACEARRPRHLVVRLDRGDELPEALARALGQAEARAAFVTGLGSLEAVDLAHFDQKTRTYGKTRRVDGPCEVVALSGNVATLDGALSVRLSAMLSRETEVGLATFAGQVVWARVYSLELLVTVLDDVTLTRAADDRTGLPVLEARPAGGAIITPPPRAPAPPPPVEPESAPPTPPAPAPAAASPLKPGPALPLRQRPQEEEEHEEEYPETGDTVVHFHFGECSVVSSSGDKIRIRQGKGGGPVLDVSLTKLRVEKLAAGADGTRRFALHRKN